MEKLKILFPDGRYIETNLAFLITKSGTEFNKDGEVERVLDDDEYSSALVAQDVGVDQMEELLSVSGEALMDMVENIEEIAKQMNEVDCNCPRCTEKKEKEVQDVNAENGQEKISEMFNQFRSKLNKKDK